MKTIWIRFMLFVPVLTQSWLLGQADTVKITPLGSKTGEFCFRDRAMLFEDPTGVRVLYDPGNTVAGGTDPRLGDVHVILVSHVHTDHVGNAKLAQDPNDPSARCSPDFSTESAPNTTTAEIAVAKNSAVFVGGGSANQFLARKMQNLLGHPTPNCGFFDSEIVVPPREGACTAPLVFGGKRTFTRSAGTPGVQVAAVKALHANDLDPSLLETGPLQADLAANQIQLSLGEPAGFVLVFSNGLKVYLSGDTGQTSDMQTVVNGFYHANLAVFNIGDIFTTGPEEAAFAVNTLIQPNAVIVSHANEVATTNGKVNPGTHTAKFIELLKDVAVYVPLSGVTMEFDGNANRGERHK
jgi:L-ascorbate metabolism protein UlaG (beta-lactamase superfamily)